MQRLTAEVTAVKSKAAGKEFGWGYSDYFFGREPAVCEKVYRDRILRGTGSDGFDSTTKLGAFGADLGVVACFFESPWSRVSPARTEAAQARLLAVAAFDLRALGRLTEALEPMRAGREMRIAQGNWRNAAIPRVNQTMSNRIPFPQHVLPDAPHRPVGTRRRTVHGRLCGLRRLFADARGGVDGQVSRTTPLTDWLPSGRWNPQARLHSGRFVRALPLEEFTLAEALREGGYRTAGIGKWHLSSEPFSLPEHHGFDVNIAGNSHGAPGNYFFPYDGGWKIPTTNLRATWNVLPDGKPDEHLTDRLTDEAVKFIRDQRDRPFLLYFPHYGVHTPLQAKPEMIARYEKVPEAERQGKPAYAAKVPFLALPPLQ